VSHIVVRTLLISATILAEVVLSDGLMVVIIAAAAIISVSLSVHGETHAVRRALCEMNKAIRAAVSKSQQQ
jgi:hypothetical protein